MLGNKKIRCALRSESVAASTDNRILHAVHGESVPLDGIINEIGHTVRDQSWRPCLLHTNLSWTHYRALLRVRQSVFPTDAGIQKLLKSESRGERIPRSLPRG